MTLLCLLKLLPGFANWLQREQAARVRELEAHVAAWKRDALEASAQAARLNEACKQLQTDRDQRYESLKIALQRVAEAETRVQRLEQDLHEKQSAIDRLSDRAAVRAQL